MDFLFYFFLEMGKHQLLFDSVLIFLGMSLGRIPQLAVFIRLSILMVKIMQWYFKKHPRGIKQAKATMHDEELQQIYTQHLLKYDTKRALASISCLGRGEVDNSIG